MSYKQALLVLHSQFDIHIPNTSSTSSTSPSSFTFGWSHNHVLRVSSTYIISVVRLRHGDNAMRSRGERERRIERERETCTPCATLTKTNAMCHATVESSEHVAKVEGESGRARQRERERELSLKLCKQHVTPWVERRARARCRQGCCAATARRPSPTCCFLSARRVRVEWNEPRLSRGRTQRSTSRRAAHVRFGSRSVRARLPFGHAAAAAVAVAVRSDKANALLRGWAWQPRVSFAQLNIFHAVIKLSFPLSAERRCARLGLGRL